MQRRVLAGAVAAVMVTLFAATPTSATGRKAPPLAAPEERLDAALHCRGVTGATTDPVILVHGNATTSTAAWRSGYVYALSVGGIPSCTVQLPDHGMDDLQVATEYVVHAIRRVAAQSGRRVSVVGHSAGGLEPLWALRYWPDLTDRVTDVVALSTPYKGGPRSSCDPGCAPALWQAAAGSRFLAAATAIPLPGGPSYTSISSTTDGIVTPDAARLDGAENIVLQDVCPGRLAMHGQMLYDYVAYRLFLDARGHAGPADARRLPPHVCSQPYLPMDTTTVAFDVAELSTTLLVVSATYPRVPVEPQLFCYAESSSTRGVGIYCPPYGRDRSSRA